MSSWAPVRPASLLRQGDSTVEPIPEAARHGRPFGTWTGANIATNNWVLGALGIALGVHLQDALLAVIIGNVIALALSGSFNFTGHWPVVNHTLIGQPEPGIRAAYLPEAVQGPLTGGFNYFLAQSQRLPMTQRLIESSPVLTAAPRA